MLSCARATLYKNVDWCRKRDCPDCSKSNWPLDAASSTPSGVSRTSCASRSRGVATWTCRHAHTSSTRRTCLSCNIFICSPVSKPPRSVSRTARLLTSTQSQLLWLVAWHSGRTSVFGVLSLSCARPVADG